MSGTPEELEGLLVNVHTLTKSQLTKELTTVVRYSQQSKRASWKGENRPNWWDEGVHMDRANVKGVIPKYGPLRGLSVEGMMAALVAFYMARIFYEDRLVGDSKIAKDTFGGRNPLPPCHYSRLCDGEAEAVSNGGCGDGGIESVHDSDQGFDDDEAVVVVGERGQSGVDDSADVEESKDVEILAKVRTPAPAAAVVKSGKGKKERVSMSCVQELDETLRRMEADPASTRFHSLRVMLIELIEEENEKNISNDDERLRIRLWFECIMAKVEAEYSEVRKLKMQELNNVRKALKVQMQKTIARIPAELKNLSLEEIEVLGGGGCESISELAGRHREKVRSQIDAAVESEVCTARRGARKVEFSTVPVTDLRRPRRGAAQSAAFKNRQILLGTPSRARKGNEKLYDINGNVVEFVYSENFSPIPVNQAVPPTPVAAGGGGGRRAAAAGKSEVSSTRSSRSKRRRGR